MRKGQAALEFLMTYGWAILVVLVAIGALAYLGVMNGVNLLPDKCTFSPGLKFSDCKASPSGLQIIILNALGSDLRNFSVTINTTGGSDVQCHVTDDTTVTTLKQGSQSAPYTLCVSESAGAAVGQRFDADVRVRYIKSGEALSHTVLGRIQTKIE